MVDDRGQSYMTTKVYELKHVSGADILPFVEGAVVRGNSRSGARALSYRQGEKEYIAVSMPRNMVQQIDDMIAKLDRAGVKDEEGGSVIEGTGAVPGFYEPKFHVSEAMLEALNEMADGQGEYFHDKQSNLVYFKQGKADGKVVTKTYILKHADPYEIRGALSQAVGARRISGVPTGVECVKYNNGSGAVIVSAEEYRFGKQPGGMQSIDDLVAMLDQPVSDDDDGNKVQVYAPAEREAAEIAENLRDVGITRPGDPTELDSGKSRLFVDPELNMIIADTPDFDRKNLSSMIEVFDRAVPQAEISFKVYELKDAINESMGMDYRAWREGAGSRFFSAGARSTENSSTVFVRFSPQWDTRYLDFLVAKERAEVVSEGNAAVTNARELRLGASDGEAGFSIRLLPRINAEMSVLDLSLSYASGLGAAPDGNLRTSQSSVSTRVQVPTNGAEIVVGGLERITDIRGASLLTLPATDSATGTLAIQKHYLIVVIRLNQAAGINTGE
ncbi:MAG: hypothetical protein JW808_11340 [Victivallales bacterium]|nr:hypothetical protein [Victivallales bacterium]